MNKNVIFAFGGISPEHEVSVLSAMQAIAALEDTGFNIIPLYITKLGRWLTGNYLLDLEHYQDLDKVESKSTPCTFTLDELGKPYMLQTEKKSFFSSLEQHQIDVLIPAFHGSEGENGSFQGICEMYNIPYTGSGVFASSIGMNKVKTKEICRVHGIPVVEGLNFIESEWVDKQPSIMDNAEDMGYPLVVKPVNLGSSIGVKKAEDRHQLIDSVETAFRYDQHLMIEKAITPLMEINCSVLGYDDQLRTSVCEHPLGKEETLSFEDKYQNEGGTGKGMASADRIIPADITSETASSIRDYSKQIFRILNAAGVARLDFLVNAETNNIYFNEINTIPGSFSFYLWEESGMSFRELMLELIDIAEQRFQRKVGRIRSYDTNLLSQKAVQGIKGLKKKPGNEA